ncbi:VOC family protein [Caulobacter sp. KR2-114]|uniref:VOC family protein n=1 Tax=Caulobacter sp. KR2-114 TaxID=3400912 RepID=UPI003C07D1CA
MRLRQVAIMAHKIAPVAGQLEYVFGLKVAFRDPGVGHFGLANVVMPAGGEFIEVLEPIRDDASGARYLQRRGGDAGYMVILQDDDALAHRARLEAMGVRVVARSREEHYRYTHFHPADTAAVLLSIDSVQGDPDWREPLSDWPPAGEQWRDYESEITLGMTAVTIQHRDPAAAAARWAQLLDKVALADGEAWEIALDGEAIRFVAPVDEDGTGVVGIELVVDDVDAVLQRAEAIGVRTPDDAVKIGGVTFTPVSGE